MERPYISLSALSVPDDVRSIDAMMQRDGFVLPDSHDYLLGISVDRTTAHAGLPTPPRKLTNLDLAKSISDEIGLPAELAIHFECYYRNQDFEIKGDVFEFSRVRTAPFADAVLNVADSVRQDSLRALQLNGVIYPEDLRKIHQARPDLKIIYQLRRELVDRGETDIIEHLKACRFGIHHVLLDLSAGRGIPIDPSEATQLISIVRGVDPDLQIGIAGGLSSVNVRGIYRAVHAAAGHVSVDTETAVRDADDNFDAVKGYSFIRETASSITSITV